MKNEPQMKINDGGPAFQFGGMTLRDYFATKALVAIPAIAQFVYANIETWSSADFAREAYRIADAMLKERSK